MAEVLVTVKIMPAEADTDLRTLSEEIRSVKEGRLHALEEEPIAFGLVALKTSFVIGDEEGVIEGLERALKGLEGVGEVEVAQVTRLL
jgi:elongation factor 1-beta